MTEPLRLTLPWGVLASDNLRKGLDRALWDRYKSSREAMRMLTMGQVHGERPRFLDGELRVRLEFWVPNARRYDVANFLKAMFDAWEGVVYSDDTQIADISILKMGMDRENPRCEAEIAPR